MPLFSWLLPVSGQNANEPPASSPMSFDDIASRLELFQNQYVNDAKLIKETSLELEARRKEVTFLQSSIRRERGLNTNLQNQDRAKTKANEAMRKELQSTRSKLQHRDVEHSQLQNKHNALTQNYNDIIKRMEDLQLEIEFLKCTTTVRTTPNESINGDMPLVPQPFVVVLVDGDAYDWASDLFVAAPGANPGAQAATRVRNTVLKYILEHPSIPVTSKIIVRVFVNESGKAAATQKSKKPLRTLSTFMVNFTESHPLFDFMDCGSGKERADEKIRENFHLYLSNPQCHCIFVAACTDNGFARMLEPYRFHTTASQKIVLVSHGYVITEIQKLGLQQVEWPSVFSHKNLVLGNKEQHRRQILETRKQLTAAAEEAHNRELGITGVRNTVVAEMVTGVMNRMSPGDVNSNSSLHLCSRGMGLRLPPRRDSQLTESEIEEGADDFADNTID